MNRYYIASDYAGLTAGEWKFYYGYEETIDGPLHTVDQDKDWEWCFVATKNGTEVLRIPSSELDSDQWETTGSLLSGIAKVLEMESDHTPAAFSPPTTQGDTNLTQPSAGEQPTSVERDRALNAAKEKYLRAEQDYEVQRFKYINDLVAEERRQAKIEEAKFQYKMWLYSKDKATTLVVAEDHIANLELRGENNEKAK